MRTLAVAGLWVVLVATGCSPRVGDPVIDTWPVGLPVDCALLVRGADLVEVVLAGLGVGDGHDDSVVSAVLHDEGTFLLPDGQQVLMTRSGGCCMVLVVTYDDGSTRAIGVGFPGISETAVAIPWETQP